MTDSERRMRKGFTEVLAALRIDTAPDYRKTIRLNTEARQAAQARVRNEWGELGLEPPCDDALSITAIRELGYRMPMIDHTTDAYQEAESR